MVLKNELKKKWLDINVTSDDAEEGTLGKIAKQRMNQAKSFGYLGYVSPCPFMYVTGGELIRLITSDAYWKYFRDYFLGSKEIMKNKLNEIGTVRNALAHFRPIKQDDVDLIKQNARHVLSKIESCLVDMMECANVVPTNTNDHWYEQLKALGTDYCSLSFNQSKDGKWIKVSFTYNCRVLSQRGGAKNKWYRVLNINTPAILHLFPELQALLVFLSEEKVYPRMQENEPEFRKRIIMVFSRDVLANEYESLRQCIHQLLDIISSETLLLQEDNLARGELVQAVTSSAIWRERAESRQGYWSFKYVNLTCDVQEHDPPEYWGPTGYIDPDYITSTNAYPWMPVAVSHFIPF
jgi:hypothetical protein